MKTLKGFCIENLQREEKKRLEILAVSKIWNSQCASSNTPGEWNPRDERISVREQPRPAWTLLQT